MCYINLDGPFYHMDPGPSLIVLVSPLLCLSIHYGFLDTVLSIFGWLSICICDQHMLSLLCRTHITGRASYVRLNLSDQRSNIMPFASAILYTGQPLVSSCLFNASSSLACMRHFSVCKFSFPCAKGKIFFPELVYKPQYLIRV